MIWNDNVNEMEPDSVVIVVQQPTAKNNIYDRSYMVVVPMYIDHSGTPCDISDYKPDVGIVYGSWEIAHWMPLPDTPAA